MFKKGDKVIVDCKCGHINCHYQNSEGTVVRYDYPDRSILLNITGSTELIFMVEFVKFANIEIFGELGD